VFQSITIVLTGADPTAQNNDGLTLLLVLLQLKRPDADLARFLIEHGTDVTAQDKDGWTLLYLIFVIH
jgi:ankyrin repeat protein